MRISSVIAITLFIRYSSAQSPYSLAKNKEVIIIGSGLAIGSSSLLLNSSPKPLSNRELSLLSSESINRLDRAAVKNRSSKAETQSDYGVLTPFALSGIMVSSLSIKKGQKEPFDNFLTLGTIWFETNLICGSITQLSKNTVKRVRPYAYSNVSFTDVYSNEGNIRRSFFSGHTSLSAANSFFVAKVLHDYYPRKEWTKLVWAGAAFVPVWTGYQRYQAGKHFPTDIIVGYLVGSTCGILIPQVHKTSQNKNKLVAAPTGNGLFLTFTF